MAKTAATGFYPRKHLYGLEHPAVQEYILAGSATVKIGDLVRVNTSGLLVRAATGEAPCGVLVGIVDQNGINVFSPRASGTTGATLTPDDTVATSSTNATDATRYLKGQVILDPAGVLLFYNDADGDLALTNLFQFFDAAAGSQITTGGASDANGQMQLMKLDPDGDADASKGLYRINENQFSGGIDSATVKNAA
jgi:hypothetical protein